MLSVLLLPGLACDAELFRHQQAALAEAHRVQVSDVHAREATLPAMAARLLAEHPGPLALVGCSMGGMLALEVWRQAPARVHGLALLGSTARPDTPVRLRLRREAIALFAQGRMEEVLRASLMLAFHPRHAADRALRNDYLAMARRAGAMQLIAQNRAVMARQDLRPWLTRIRCPVRLLVGDSDRLAPLACSQEIADAVPSASLTVLKDCGHMPTWEQPATVTAALQDWLAGLSA
jgi:pimeloyl-ACP methyl ester carboxylesterase